jgi:hypothetical protein
MLILLAHFQTGNHKVSFLGYREVSHEQHLTDSIGAAKSVRNGKGIECLILHKKKYLSFIPKRDDRHFSAHFVFLYVVAFKFSHL